MNADNSLLAQTLDKIKLVCHVAGINIKNNKDKDLKLKLVYLFNFQWLNFDLGGAIGAFIVGIIDGKNFVEVTYIAPCMTFSLLANIKSLSVIFNANRLQELIGILKKMEIKDKDRKNKSKIDIIIKEEIGFLHNLLRMLNITYSVLLTGFAVNPLILTVYKYYKTKELHLQLPFLILYPFDQYALKNWPAVYVHQVWSNVVVLLGIGASDYIFYICCTFITLRFRIIQVEIEDLLLAHTTLKSFQTKFREIVLFHQELIRCSQILEEIYTKSILFNFVSSSILICLTGFDVMVLTDKIMVMSFVSFLFTSLLQIFFLCFFGDLLMRSSMGVGDAVYKCQWYGKHPSIGKSLLLMMIRSHKPCKVTAYGFADVNLTAFMRVLSNAWSYFALLNTIYG